MESPGVFPVARAVRCHGRKYMQMQAFRTESERIIDEIDRARAQEYALLATLLSRSPDAQMIGRLALLQGDASPLGICHAALGAAAACATAEAVRREYFDLFDGLGRAKLMPYASYYLTGSTYGRPLSRLREVLQRLGIERTERQLEPEDHVAMLCEIMAGLVSGNVAAPPSADRIVFEEHLAPWIGRFFADLEHDTSADFYARVGALGRTFIEIEAKAFTLSA